MKPKTKPRSKTPAEKAIAAFLSSNLQAHKIARVKTNTAIQKKLAEIKKESRMPAVLNNNIALFRNKA